MLSVPELLRQKLAADLVSDSRWCVALSGGLDSSVLLHAICHLRAEFNRVAIRAIHVNHGLHPGSAEWASACEIFCAKLGVPLRSEVVRIDPGAGDGLESAARRARYGLFSAALDKGEYLLTAHHQDDQIETVLLRLLRGAGTHGLAGIAERRQFATGWLLRPLLECSRQQLEAYARTTGIEWVDDPSNVDTSIDRNYLRHEIAPRLRDRWPGLAHTVSRAARLAQESAGLLDDLAEADGRNLIVGEKVDAAALSSLNGPRQRNLIRYLVRSRGMAMPSEAQLRAGLDQLMSARIDGQPVLRWSEGQIRRYRGQLFVLEFDPDPGRAALPSQFQWDGAKPVDMGPVRGRLRLESGPGGLSRAAWSQGLAIRFRHGGERIRAVGQQHHKSLKKLFQARGIVPWMRAHVPLLYAGDQLVAVGDLWLAADAAAAPDDSGYRVVWENHPTTE